VPLNAHPGHADDVGPGATVEIDRLDVLVDGVIAWPAGVNAASSERAATGKFARFPKRGSACSMPQNDISNRGLIRTMSAMLHTFPGDRRQRMNEP
jgi:hypothetical protein